MIEITLDQDGSGRAFDAALQDTLPSGNHTRIITKSQGTAGGNPIVLIGFDVQVDGRRYRAQQIVTAREFLRAAVAIAACHPGLDGPLTPDAPVGHKLSAKHRGVGYDAILVERVYLVSIEGGRGLVVASNELEVHALAQHAIDAQLAEADRHGPRVAPEDDQA